MKEVQLSIDKAQVWNEVAKTAAYTGMKMQKDDLAYERIALVDEDKEMLERFWAESKSLVADNLKRMLKSETEEDGEYTVALRLSNAFKEELVDSMRQSLLSFFVSNILAKWFIITNKEEAEVQAKAAEVSLEDVLRKAYYKKQPMRPTYD